MHVQPAAPKASSIAGPSMRMYPAVATTSIPRSRRSPPRPGRSPRALEVFGWSTADSTRWASVRFNALMSGRSESTRAIRGPRTGWSRRACRFVPEPETAPRSAPPWTWPRYQRPSPPRPSAIAVKAEERAPRANRGRELDRPGATRRSTRRRIRRPRSSGPASDASIIRAGRRFPMQRLRGARLRDLRGTGPGTRVRSRCLAAELSDPRSRRLPSRANRDRSWTALVGAALALLATVGPSTRTGAGDRLFGAWFRASVIDHGRRGGALLVPAVWSFRVHGTRSGATLVILVETMVAMSSAPCDRFPADVPVRLVGPMDGGVGGDRLAGTVATASSEPVPEGLTRHRAPLGYP